MHAEDTDFAAVLQKLARRGGARQLLSYPNLRALAGQLHLRLRRNRSEPHGRGIDFSAVAAACKRQRVLALYCVQSLHNPTTGRLGLASG